MSLPSAVPSLSSYRIVRVKLGERSYDVVIGRNLLHRVGRLLFDRQLTGEVFPITDSQIEGRGFLEALADGIGPVGALAPKDSVLFGESSKSMQNVVGLLSRLAKRKVPRSGIILALGGGVIGDLAGFVAASYLRGINFVQVPTTLLAMVDSSVGGKTGVNLPEGKNLVGAFHQPRLVVADLDTLSTLPPHEFAAGMAEVIKYGAIKDKALFDRVIKEVKPDDADLDEIVEKCVTIKARVVENDEFETKGERALLNFGHTIGHAIEKATEYKMYLHGEAISLGMRAAAWLSRREAGLSQEDARDLDVALIANQLPVVLDKRVDSQAVLAALGNDKKVAADGVNRWVLLTKMGVAESGRVVSPALVAQAVEYLRTHPDDL
jgi:3-dehydroquinate synthase